MFSAQQAVYFKYYLTAKNKGNEVTRLNSSLHESKISINPHQINAALSFFKNPLNRGFLFADEVGLGKTIEAGIIISQYWYERKRKIIIICPASLVKQWHEELYDKFHIESTVIDGNLLKKKKFKWDEKIYITSLHTVYLNNELFNSRFDLVVIDEAHKLRNVYKDNTVMAPTIKRVFNGQKKLLLTATPFQNDLMELYGLMSLLDENIFPDEKVFRNKYILNYHENKDELVSILSNYIVRTLRKNVSKYINYTNRNVILSDYFTTDSEKEFYRKVTNILYSKDFTEVYSTGQNQLLVILLQKLLSSSMYAVIKTLYNMKSKLISKTDNSIDFKCNDIPDKYIENIDEILSFSKTLDTDSKYNCLLEAINNIKDNIFIDKSRKEKILIFTESKKTQEYLFSRLQNDGYKFVLTFNGENDSDQVKKVYEKWLLKNKDSLVANKSLNMRRAIIDAFENEYDILIATDAASEGLNMQFCSVLINYDLPWNPQKIEQRIGRCHRYGQKNDVIVINMLNRSSTIDQRIYELLNSKLGIFEITFGSSDVILGNDNIANDIEASIKEVYKKSRTPEEIEILFKKLQNKFKDEIESAIKQSESEMENYFDEEVQRNFELQYIQAKQAKNEYEDILSKLIHYVYPKIVIDDNLCFLLDKEHYTITNNFPEKKFVSLNDEFGIKLLNSIGNSIDTIDTLIFHYSNSKNKIGYIDASNLKKGCIFASIIRYNSFDSTEVIVLSAISNDGEIIPQDIIHKILKLDASNSNLDLDETMYKNTLQIHINGIDDKIEEIANYNNEIFSKESEFIDNWADTMIEKIQLEVSQMRDERKELNKQFDASNSVKERAALQERMSEITKRITKQWILLANAEDEINDKRNELIKKLLLEKNKEITVSRLFEMGFVIL